MKIMIDDRPVEGGGFTGKPETALFYGIRLVPESNADMAALERALDLGISPVSIERISNPDEVHYLILFGKPKE